MQRRSFIVGAASVGAVAALGAAGAVGYEHRRSHTKVRRYGSIELRQGSPAADAPNVLFIALDDCNDWVGFLNNHPGTYTPNIDALAAESLVFSQAYCSAPMCRPARTGVMFGRAPYETGVYDHSDASNANLAEFERVSSSFVDDFWAAGYDVVGGGKIFGDSQRGRWTQFQATPVDEQDPNWISPWSGLPNGTTQPPRRGMIDFGPSGIAPEDEPDGQTGAWVLDQLDAPRTRPLFLGYGLISTHVAWRVPQRFFDLHPIENVVVPDYRPDDLDDLGPAALALIDRDHTVDQLRDSGLWAAAVQAYQAAISYADDRVGLILDALASSRYAQDTIVVLWSDHGFHLGEKLHWHKFTLWERATHIPMLFRIPGQPAQVFDRPVSAIDIGPTLTDLCGVTMHGEQSGRSLVPTVAQPALADDRPPISTWLPGNHAVRRGPWRYIRYRSGEAELYDHRDDIDEYTNLAGQPQFAELERELAAFLPAIGDEVDRNQNEKSGAGTD
jgi:arylsulfatase A-like enzyme